MTMRDKDQDIKPGDIAIHVVLILAGLAMTVLGVGLCVTMVLLPIGLPLALPGFDISDLSRPLNAFTVGHLKSSRTQVLMSD